MISVFDTIVLSSGNSGIPNTYSYPVSAEGVMIRNLVSNHSGLSFNKKISRSGNLLDMVIEGSQFQIDAIYDGDMMALIKNNGTHITFQFLSSTDVQIGYVPSYISTPDTRRKFTLGYNAGSRYYIDIPAGYVTLKQPDGSPVLQPNGLNIYTPL